MSNNESRAKLLSRIQFLPIPLVALSPACMLSAIQRTGKEKNLLLGKQTANVNVFQFRKSGCFEVHPHMSGGLSLCRSLPLVKMVQAGLWIWGAVGQNAGRSGIPGHGNQSQLWAP